MFMLLASFIAVPSFALDLQSSALLSGDRLTLAALGAERGEIVWFARGDGLGSGPCIAAAGGLCLDITGAAALGSVPADDDGRAVYTVNVPGGLSGEVAFQALVMRGEKSDAIELSVDGAVWLRDADYDGFGDPMNVMSATGGSAPFGYTDLDGDCADDNDRVHRGAPEICDGLDNDCGDAWTSADEAGLATFFKDHGTVIDVTVALAEGPFTPDAGGELRFCDGDFSAEIQTDGYDLDLRSQGPRGSSRLTSSAGRVLEADGVNIDIEGLTITGVSGTIDVPEALWVNGGTLTLSEVDLLDNNARALSLIDTDASIVDVSFERNVHPDLDDFWSEGGAIHASGGQLALTDVSFLQNHANHGADVMVQDDAVATLVRVDVSGSKGRSALRTSHGASLDIRDSTVASTQGVGVRCYEFGSISLSDVLVTDTGL